jgi:hypothetical protein
MPYSISDHKHRFAAWTAGRAASVKGSRFKVKFIQELLRDIGFAQLVDTATLPDPDPVQVDAKHKEWRIQLLEAAERRGVSLSHGVAAKIINVYLKTVFVCGGAAGDPKVMALHPPIDSVLLDALYEKDIGKEKLAWKHARRIRWSLLSSDEYEAVVAAIRRTVGGAPMWAIEEHWKGYQ